jgi:EAL domain-containing protein (putative c-di-GMP-specific phosphodiesterase class I)
VENEAQWRFLRDHVCDEMQGFFFSPPVPPEQLAELLQSDRTRRD